MKILIYLLPVISGILWGACGIFVRTLYAFGINNFTVLFSRVSIAVTMLFIGMLVYDKSLLKIRPKDLWIFIAAGILGMMSLNLCYNEAIDRLTLSLAAVLLNLAPIFVLAFAAILFKEKITLQKIGCMLLALTGCLLVSGILENSAGLKWTAIGIILGIAAAFFYALYSIFSKTAMERGYNVLTITFYSLLACALVSLPFADLNILGEFIMESPAGNSLFLLLQSLFTSVLPYVFYTLSLVYIEAGKAAILTAGGEPIAAMFLGILLFSEMPTPLSVAGLAVTIIAIALLFRPAKAQT